MAGDSAAASVHLEIGISDVVARAARTVNGKNSVLWTHKNFNISSVLNYSAFNFLNSEFDRSRLI